MLFENDQPQTSNHSVLIVAMAIILFFVFNIIRDRDKTLQPSNLSQVNNTTNKSARSEESHIEQPTLDPADLAWPYEHYRITQGLHGSSYGHMAIDLSAGKGAVIKSPINGSVSARFTDEWGNPTLVIENELYRVLLLHGEYTVQVGDQVTIGKPIGYESNLGYTTDMKGNPCKNRECGYHTHLNIFDKIQNTNVNPLDLLAEKN